MRDKAAIAVKYISTFFFTMIFGLVYWQLDEGQKSIRDRTGLLFFCCMNMAFGSADSAAGAAGAAADGSGVAGASGSGSSAAASRVLGVIFFC